MRQVVWLLVTLHGLRASNHALSLLWNDATMSIVWGRIAASCSLWPLPTQAAQQVHSHSGVAHPGVIGG
jgi:hypothetical protein